MSTREQEFQAFLDLQRANYRRALPEKMAQLLALWGAVQASDEAAQPLRDLERGAHSLAGTAGTLGFGAVGLAAAALELLLTQARECGPALTPARHSGIALAIAGLQASLPDD